MWGQARKLRLPVESSLNIHGPSLICTASNHSSLFWCCHLQFFGKWIDPINTAGQIRFISLEGKRLVSLGMWYTPEQAFVYMLLGKVDSASDYEGDMLNNISWYGKAAARSTWSKVFSTYCKCARWTHSPGCWQDAMSGSGRSFPLLICCSVTVKWRRRRWGGVGGKGGGTALPQREGCQAITGRTVPVLNWSGKSQEDDKTVAWKVCCS